MFVALVDLPVRWTITVAVIGAAGAITAALVARLRHRPKPPRLVLEDLTIDDVDAEMVSPLTGNVVFRYKLPALHVFTRNTGEQTAVASRAKLSIRHIWHLQLQGPLMQHLESSASYSIDIDPSHKAPYELEIPISHSIAANESDKFDITMGLNPLEPFESLYHIEVSLFFGSVWSNALDCLVVLPARDGLEPQYLIGAFYKHYEDLEQRRKDTPTDITQLAPYRQTLIKLQQEWLSEDLSPEGKENALKAAQEIDEHNRVALRAAAKASERRSPRAAQLIERIKET